MFRTLKAFPKMLRHKFGHTGMASIIWRYGAGLAEYDYKFIDVLNLSKPDANKNVINMLSTQYKKIVYNKVYFRIKNVIIGWRMEEDCVNEIEWESKLNRKPFGRGRYFQSSNNSCDENTCMKVVKKSSDTETFTMATVDSNPIPFQKVMCRNYKGPLPTSFSSVYYPKCTKSVACESASLPYEKKPWATF